MAMRWPSSYIFDDTDAWRSVRYSTIITTAGGVIQQGLTPKADFRLESVALPTAARTVTRASVIFLVTTLRVVTPRPTLRVESLAVA
jgi:hypothetical protein